MNIAAFGIILGGAVLAAAPPPAPTLDDAKILEILDVVNTGQIDQAQLALSRTQAAPVKTFARAMIEDHTDVRDEGREIAKRIGITPTPCPISNDLKAENSQTISQLRPLHKGQFDHAYMESQVTIHRRVLGLIDARLLPDARAAEVKALLSGVRGHVDEHLEKAEKVVEKLPSS
jgi:putative membrane protein